MFDDCGDGPIVVLSKSITTSLGFPVPWLIGGVLVPGIWDTERPDCKKNVLLSEENNMFGLRACCTNATISFKRLLLKFPDGRVVSLLPAPRRSPLLPVERIRANGTRPLNELRKPAPLLLFDMLPSIELTDVCLSTVIGSDGG